MEIQENKAAQRWFYIRKDKETGRIEEYCDEMTDGLTCKALEQ